LKIFRASSASAADFTVIILGASLFLPISFLKPSMKTMSCFSHFFRISLSEKFSWFVFSMVAILLRATLIIFVAPDRANLQVSFPSVSIVKFFSGMCFIAAIL